MEDCALGVHEFFAFAEDAGRHVETVLHLFELGGGGLARDLHAVDFEMSRHSGPRAGISRVQQCVGPLRVVGEQEQSFARGIEAAHRRYVRYGLAGEQLSTTLRSFYFQRCGVELTPDRAGKWARPAAHLDYNIEFHPSMERSGSWNAHGGWYDAGDYGKYIVNGGVSVATLLLAAEFADDRRMTFSNADFFDAGSFRSNLLEEIRFKLEFFLRMQDDDGGVFFKVSPVRWDGFVSPSQSDALQKRQILGKSTTSTLNFAGALAQAHRVFANVYPSALSGQTVLWGRNCENAAKMTLWLCPANLYCCELATDRRMTI